MFIEYVYHEIYDFHVYKLWEKINETICGDAADISAILFYDKPSGKWVIN